MQRDAARRPYLVIRWAPLALIVIALLSLLPRDREFLVYLALIMGAQVLSLTATQLSKGWHPTVEPTGELLEPRPATATWPRTFPLTKMYQLRNRQWLRRWRRSRRLALLPGRLWLGRPGETLELRWSNPYQLQYSAAWSVDPLGVRLVQPLLSRSGKPGIVLHLLDGSPVFLYGPAPREEMLTEIAAAGFTVDGAEQVVSRRWARTPRRRDRPVPA